MVARMATDRQTDRQTSSSVKALFTLGGAGIISNRLYIFEYTYKLNDKLIQNEIH